MKLKARRLFHPPIYWVFFSLIVGVGVLIRISAAFNDLWMDEIWSVELIRELHSAIGVFTQTHHDNNHYLNSLFIYFLGQHGNWPGYRVLSEIAGICTIVVAWFIGARQNKWTAFFSMLLVSFSYVLILYSSEARGYMELILFCFLCFLILQRFFERPSWKFATFFSLSAILGFTSHLTFLIFLGASLVWFCVRLRRLNFSLSKIVGWAAACYATPVAYVAALYVVDLRYFQIGGGTPISVLDGYGATLAWALGGPNASPFQLLTGTICVAGLLWGLFILVRQRSDEWIFFFCAIVAFPLAMPLFEHGTLHYVRYFIVALGFLLLLLGRVLGWLFQSGRAGKILCGFFCSAFIALNLWDVRSLLNNGRGQISEAVNFMVQNAKEQPVSFGGEQDFRTQFMLGFYWREMMGDKPANYYDHDHWPNEGPEWVVFHEESFREPVPPGKRFTDKFGNGFELVRAFPTAPLSGVHLFLYHKIAKAGSP